MITLDDPVIMADCEVVNNISDTDTKFRSGVITHVFLLFFLFSVTFVFLLIFLVIVMVGKSP